MSFEDDPFLSQDPLRQSLRALRLIVRNAFVSKLNTGLNHNSNYPFPSRPEPASYEGLVMHIKGTLYVLRTGDSNFQFALRATRRGNLRSDDVDRRLRSFCCYRLSKLAQVSGTLGNHAIAQNVRVVCTAHAGIQVYLGEACSREILNHDGSLLHRLMCWRGTPRIRAKMISAEDQPVFGKMSITSQRKNIVAKLHRGEPRVTAILIDLVASGLYEQQALVVRCLSKCSFQHQPVR